MNDFKSSDAVVLISKNCQKGIIYTLNIDEWSEQKNKLEYLKLHIWQFLWPKSQNSIKNFLEIAIPKWEQAIQEVDTPHFSYWRATT